MQTVFSSLSKVPGIFLRVIPIMLSVTCTGVSLGAPNPAAVYCTEMGYQLNEGKCVFPDGSSCEQFAFYKGSCGSGWSYCERHGGDLETRTENMGSYTADFPICRFNDGSECIEQEFMKGMCRPAECYRWKGSKCLEPIEPEMPPEPDDIERPDTDETPTVEPEEEDEETVEEFIERIRREMGLREPPLTVSTSFSCYDFKRSDAPMKRQVLAPGDLLIIDLCAQDDMGCDWEDQADVDAPQVLHQEKHKDLGRNKMLLRFKPKERFFFMMDDPGTAVIRFTCRDDSGESVKIVLASVTVDPSAIRIGSGSESGIKLMTPEGEKIIMPSETMWISMLKCKMIRKGKNLFDSYSGRLYDQRVFTLCAADWMGCDWVDTPSISDTGVVQQYKHRYVEKPIFRKYPEEEFYFLAVGEGSSEITFTCVNEKGEDVRSDTVTLNVGEEQWAEYIPFRKKEEEESDTTAALEPLCYPDTEDPCRHCSHFDRLDYVYYKPSGSGLTLVPTEARVIKDWKYKDTECDPPIETDLSDHYPLLVKFAIEGERAPAQRKEITLLNYNVHAFAGFKGAIAELAKDKVMLYQDYRRLAHIANRIVNLDPDIVALQEVWGGLEQEAFSIVLRDHYRYIYSGPKDLGLRMTSGVLVLSKFPIRNVKSKAFPIALPIIAGMIPTSIKNEDAWARKGVVTADVEIASGTTFRLGVSHALTDQDIGKGKWSKNYYEYGITTFDLNGEPYIFALKNWPRHERIIARLYDFSWDYDGERHHDAGWRVIDTKRWSSQYQAVVSFELEGHPHLFALHSTDHKAFIRRITDQGRGFTNLWSDRWSSLYKGSAFTSFQLNGHPHIFGLKKGGNNSGKAQIARIKAGGNGYDNSVWGDWGLVSPQFVVPFQLNGRPYLFETRGQTARIARVEIDPSTERITGWKFVYDKPISDIPSNCSGPHRGGGSHAGVLVERIYAAEWGNDFFVTRAFNLNGHPHIFSLKSMAGEDLGTLPGEGYLTRINDDGRGWENLVRLPHMQTIIDETIQDDVPAIMMGDFNVHWDHYGNMNRMFETFGAHDAYVAVHGNNLQGSETIDACNNNLTQVFRQKPNWFRPCLGRVPPIVSPPAIPDPPENKCNDDYDRGEVTSVTPFVLNGQPHILVLTKKARKTIHTKNMADIYRISGGY